MTRRRFVLLEHDHPHLHWDLMLEEAEGLRTWRLPAPTFGVEEMEADPLPMHRKAYLDYEGAVSGRRGNVKRIDAGHYSHEGDWDANEGTLQWDGSEGPMVLRWRRTGDRWFFRRSQ